MIMTLCGHLGAWTAYPGLAKAMARAAHIKVYGDKGWEYKEIPDITVPFRVYDAAHAVGVAVTPLWLVGRFGAYTGYYDMTRQEAVSAHNATHGDEGWAVECVEAAEPFRCYDAEEI